MIDLADPQYLAPRPREFQSPEKRHAAEEDYRYEVQSALREIADAKLIVVAQKVILRRFKGEIPFEPAADSPAPAQDAVTPNGTGGPFVTKEQRIAARVRAQGTGSVLALATKLDVDRTQLNRWENHHLNGKSLDTRNRIETGILKILATLKCHWRSPATLQQYSQQQTLRK